MSEQSKVRNWAEYAAVRCAVGVVNAVPYRVALAWAWGIAWVLYYAARMRRERTRRRIREVFPEASERRVREIGFLALRNLAFNVVEMMRLGRFSVKTLVRRIEGSEEGLAMLRRLRGEGGRGVILAGGHLGSWDMAACLVAREGVPLFTIMGRQRNPLIHDWLWQMHIRCGMRVYERGKVAVRELLGRLRSGETLAVLTDTRMSNPEVSVPFLGKVANLGRGMASFARAENVPILPTLFVRVGWTRFRIDTAPPVVPDMSCDKQADIARMTREVASSIERTILAAPEQWFGWYNGRWVLDPL